MPKPHRARFVALADLLVRHRPDVPLEAVAEGRVLVDGRIVANPAARVRADAAVRVEAVRRLRGDIKLSHALDALAVDASGRVAIDIGASAGGFTTALLDRGARRVYAVDVGVGQLLGRLRADPRVVNLEGYNLSDLDQALVPDTVELVVIDLSYLAVAEAVGQLGNIDIAPRADLVALVKPTFELRRGTLAAADADVAAAAARASAGIARAGWHIVGDCAAPATGRRGAREAFVHARREDGKGS